MKNTYVIGLATAAALAVLFVASGVFAAERPCIDVPVFGLMCEDHDSSRGPEAERPRRVDPPDDDGEGPPDDGGENCPSDAPAK